MGLREFIIPQDRVFFDMLFEQSKILLRGAEALFDLMMNNDDVATMTVKINDLEHQGDAVAHEIYQRLNRTFITPIDQEDLISLASKCDDVLDAINGVSKRISIFEIKQPTESMMKFAGLILKAAKEINHLLTNIRKADQKDVGSRCEEIDKIENQGDELLHTSLVELFREKDAVKIIKFKEIYEWLESALDRCEDVGYAIADIVIKNR